MLVPDGAGVTLIDALSGTPLRRLTSPGHAILGVIADPTGRRLVTIEQAARGPVGRRGGRARGRRVPRAAAASIRSTSGTWTASTGRRPRSTRGPPRAGGGRGPSRLGRRRTGLRWSRSAPTARPSPSPRPTRRAVRLFSADDGTFKPAGNFDRHPDRGLGPGPGAQRPDGRGRARPESGSTTRTAGGAVASTSFTDAGLSFTRLMRFSPAGTLALAGWGDGSSSGTRRPQSRVAVLPGSEQSFDLAFSPDGRTLAAVGPDRGDLDLDHPGFGDADPAQRLRRAALVAGLRPRRDPGRRRLGRRGLDLAAGAVPGGRPPLPLVAAGDAEPSTGREPTPADRRPRTRARPAPRPSPAAPDGRRPGGESAGASRRPRPRGGGPTPPPRPADLAGLRRRGAPGRPRRHGRARLARRPALVQAAPASTAAAMPRAVVQRAADRQDARRPDHGPAPRPRPSTSGAARPRTG